MNSHIVSELSQVVTALTMLTALGTTWTKGGKWLYRIVEAVTKITEEVQNLSVRMAAVEAKLDMTPTVVVAQEPPQSQHHDTPQTR